jgi:replicative DNA helicase
MPGLLEQYVDMVLFLYRDKYYNMDTRCGDTTELIIARQKNGCCGTVYPEWHPGVAEFTDENMDQYQPLPGG